MNEPDPLCRDPQAMTDADWRKVLTPEQYEVMRGAGTERPGTGKLLHNKRQGAYMCAGCGAHLFDSDAKFDSGSGWPSFHAAAARENIVEIQDASHGMVRTEVRCKRCNAHLGHLFDDGPDPTGMRYCINSVCLGFREKD